jgi:hypothetical protein
MTVSVNRFAVTSVEVLHVRFLALVPQIETHAQICFRGIRCPVTREDRVQECIALGWKWFLRLAEQGKDVFAFPMAFAALVARTVRCGRRLCGQERARDVLSPLAQQRHAFRVGSLPTSTCSSHVQLYATPNGQALLDAFEERLRDDARSPVPDQAAFRIDFPAWLRTLTGRERRLARAMAQGERTTDLSKQFELSPGRISQLRRAFRDAWERFHGEQAPCHRRTAAR